MDCTPLARATCLTLQIVRRIVDDVLGKERKSMRDIMGALCVKVRAVPCCACSVCIAGQTG